MEKKKVENVIAPNVEFRMEKVAQVDITKLGNFEMVEAFNYAKKQKKESYGYRWNIMKTLIHKTDFHKLLFISSIFPLIFFLPLQILCSYVAQVSVS